MDIFNNIIPNRPRRSVFNLSHDVKMTCDMGQLIPVMCLEANPGDVFELGMALVARFMPMVSPMLHEVNVTMHYWFCPTRLLWDEWEEFITGGVDGNNASVLPRWNPGTAQAAGSLWDYLGFPPGIVPAGLSAPIDFPKRMYNLTWNQWYRDETLQPEVDIDTSQVVLYRAWEKDYFTSALLTQQRGTAPALPISGITHAIWPASAMVAAVEANAVGVKPAAAGDNKLYGGTAIGQANLLNAFNLNTVDLSLATTFNPSDLRLAFQIQRWQERNARGGVRYTESLFIHHGVSPRDDRLQRVEYIGGSKSPVIISEVLQTSSTDATTPQGNMAGHGIAADRQYVGRYHCLEYGYVMAIMSVMPKTAYQQGINKQFLRRTKLDFFWPEFTGLSEEKVELEEIYAGNDEATNRGLFGYQGRYNELRYMPSRVCGLLRSSPFWSWHLGRIFGSAPTLSASFISSADISKRVFAAPSEPCMLVNLANIVKVARPMPIIAEPGYIDHN